MSIQAPTPKASSVPLRRRRWLVVTLILLLCGAGFTWIALQIAHKMAVCFTEQHLADMVSRATTAEEETRAFQLVQRSGGQYAVDFYDRNGNRMQSTGFDMTKVYSIEITFPQGTTVRRQLSKPGDLGSLLLE